MSKRIRFIVHGSLLAALYVVLTYAQNLLWPESTTMAIQLRISEALGIFAFFTPAAIPGLTVGCLLYNVSWIQSLPLDWLVGTLATLLAAASMWGLRRVKFHGCPWLGLLMPAVFNGPLVGWELTVYLAPDGFTWPVFWLNALYVFLGESIVLMTVGAVLYHTLTARRLDQRLFGQ